MKPSRARVCIGITTDVRRRCLSARQQYPVADQQKRRPSACRDQPCASRAGRAGGTGLLHLAGTWRVPERLNPLDKNGFGLSVAEADRLARVIERDFEFLPDCREVHDRWRSLLVAYKHSRRASSSKMLDCFPGHV